jgi:hypothetical protein
MKRNVNRREGFFSLKLRRPCIGPRSIGIFLTDVFINVSEIPGNLKGDGTLLGGVFVLGNLS